MALRSVTSEADTYRYLTMEECLRQNGDRHLRRAFDHLYNDRPKNYWQGSLRKALRNYEAADKLKLEDDVLKLVDFVLQPIINNIINYGGSSKKLHL